jgi:DNA-binding CsgD family transcriptional regulator
MLRGKTAWVVYGVLGTFGFALFLTLEMIAENGPFTLVKLVLEALELLLIIGTAGVTALLFSRFRAHQEEQAVLLEELDEARSQGQAWRERAQRHITGLSRAIQEQFDQWGLSVAESEVAMLMLKGFSHKEIARLRNTSEQTIRQQARVVYAKADVNSRHAFCAFFLEDLLLPTEEEKPQLRPVAGA